MAVLLSIGRSRVSQRLEEGYRHQGVGYVIEWLNRRRCVSAATLKKKIGNDKIQPKIINWITYPGSAERCGIQCHEFINLFFLIKLAVLYCQLGGETNKHTSFA